MCAFDIGNIFSIQTLSLFIFKRHAWEQSISGFSPTYLWEFWQQNPPSFSKPISGKANNAKETLFNIIPGRWFYQPEDLIQNVMLTFIRHMKSYCTTPRILPIAQSVSLAVWTFLITDIYCWLCLEIVYIIWAEEGKILNYSGLIERLHCDEYFLIWKFIV